MFELKVYPKHRDWQRISFRYNDMEALMIAAQSLLEHYCGEDDERELTCEISIVKTVEEEAVEPEPEPEPEIKAENENDESEEN